MILIEIPLIKAMKAIMFLLCLCKRQWSFCYALLFPHTHPHSNNPSKLILYTIIKIQLVLHSNYWIWIWIHTFLLQIGSTSSKSNAANSTVDSSSSVVWRYQSTRSKVFQATCLESREYENEPAQVCSICFFKNFGALIMIHCASVMTHALETCSERQITKN